MATEVGRQTAAPAEIEVAAADEPAEDAADGADANPDAAADEVTRKACAPRAERKKEDAAKLADKPHGKTQQVLTPELQTYFLTCVKAGIDGVEPNRGRGLAPAAKGDDQLGIVADVTGVIDGILKHRRREREKTTS